MSDKTAIEWCDSTWTPLRVRRLDDGKVGVHCEKVSPGCAHCYSETFNRRRLPNQGTGLDFTKGSRQKVETFVDENILAQPLKWKRPRRIFVCSQTDLFGEFHADEQIDRVFAVMSFCQEHTFQILTKRAERMRSYLAGAVKDRSREAACRLLDAGVNTNGRAMCAAIEGVAWPLPNVHLGVSVEDQQRADERIPDLLSTPAAVRWLSVEPLLGAVDLREYQPFRVKAHPVGDFRGARGILGGHVDWVVVGGESGPRARPCDVAWVRGIVEQCRAAKVACFVKQLGSCAVGVWEPEMAHVETWRDRIKTDDRKGGDPSEWPADLRVREFPEAGR